MLKKYFPYVLPLFLSACFLLPADDADAHHHHHDHEHKTKKKHHHSVELRSNYLPPGPPSDPWGPYVEKAAQRFDIPASWIRGVIKQESGGKQFNSRGELMRSSVGAMGLMQLMPSAYKFLSEQYHLGADPYDPYNNIMAGTAYIRQLYEVYGSPGFLAAYNAGPGRVDRYLKTTHSLPPETRNYVASISRYLNGHHPRVRSRTDLLVTKFNGTADEQWAATYMLNTMKKNQNLIDTRHITIPPKPKPQPKPKPKHVPSRSTKKTPVSRGARKPINQQDSAYRNVERALSEESGAKRTSAASKITRNLESVPNKTIAPKAGVRRSKNTTSTKKPIVTKKVTKSAAKPVVRKKIVAKTPARKSVPAKRPIHKVVPKKK